MSFRSCWHHKLVNKTLSDIGVRKQLLQTTVTVAIDIVVNKTTNKDTSTCTVVMYITRTNTQKPTAKVCYIYKCYKHAINLSIVTVSYLLSLEDLGSKRQNL